MFFDRVSRFLVLLHVNLFSPRVRAAAFACAGLAVAGCAQSPQQLATNHHPKEYFPSSKYGPASRRVIADGQPIPHGGGQYLVGKPYTVAGQTYYPSERKITQVGLASWYGDAFHGRLTANGEIYDRDGFTAAHPTMPLPSYARVTNLRNNYSMIVRVNDRGPYASNRIMDVSRRVADTLDFQRGGTAKIKVEYVGRASLAGSDDAKLYATLRTNGPARFDGFGEGVAVAQSETRPVHLASTAPYMPALNPALPPERTVENERPSMLEAYRVPPSSPRRVATHDAPVRTRIASEESDDQTEPRPRSALRVKQSASKEAISPSSHRATETRVAMHDMRIEHGREARAEMAERGISAAEARAFAARELQSPPRSGRGVLTAKTLARMSIPLPPIAHGAARATVLPQARPVRLASATPAWSSRRAAGVGHAHASQGD